VTGALDLRPILPAAIVAVSGLAVLLVQAFTPKGRSAPSTELSVAGLVASLASVWLLATGEARGRDLAGALSADDFSLFLQALVLVIAILAVLLSSSYLRACGCERGEYYALLLFSVVGMLGLVSSLELVAMFVALEIMSIPLYAMAGMRRDRPQSQEAALKYFITGSFSSAFFLYGVALLYGACGSTSLEKIARTAGLVSGGSVSLAVLGAALLLVGFGFKVASVPFHMWAPDVYEGAPTPATAFMAAGVKAAAFGAFLRVFGSALPGLASQWHPLVGWLALLTMVVGNLAALAQTNLKRMLAYSSIAHAGYLFYAFLGDGPGRYQAVVFYVLAYGLMNLLAFASLPPGKDDATRDHLDHLTGLYHRDPFGAVMIGIAMLSLAGIPPLPGFIAKFLIFKNVMAAGYTAYAVLGLVGSYVGIYFYLRVIQLLFMTPKEAAAGTPIGHRVAIGTCLLCLIPAILLAVFPGWVIGRV